MTAMQFVGSEQRIYLRLVLTGNDKAKSKEGRQSVVTGTLDGGGYMFVVTG